MIDVTKLAEDKVSRAKALLKDLELEDIVVISAGAATFFQWVKNCVYVYI